MEGLGAKKENKNITEMKIGIIIKQNIYM